jgi:Domain of unknown function (DUF4389)
VSSQPHPVRIVVTDDLHRSRLTVFFRLFLAIPHYIWAFLIGSAVAVCVFANWFILLVKGRTPDGLHGFIAGYIRYLTHLEAYFLLAANPFPPFYLVGSDPYPVDLEIDPPERQNRWKTGFRLFLAIPASLVAGTLISGDTLRGAAGTVALLVAFLAWWVALIRGRVPRGMRNLVVYCIAYGAQLWAYLFLVTDRYPFASPAAFVPSTAEIAAHPVSLRVTDDLRRSRVTVFFRLLLAIPHIVWFLLWSIVAAIVALLTWVCAIAIGRPPRPFYRFLSRFVRYSTHLYAFLTLVGNPFPGFVGKPGSYPIDLELPPLAPQKRLVTAFRLVLAFPAFVINAGIGGAVFVVALLGWFVGLFLGRMPEGLRNLGAYGLRYGAQVNAYLYLITSTYPDSGPRSDPASP